MQAAHPGDLVTVRQGMARLYKLPGPADENSGNAITGIANSKQVGLLLAVTTSVGDKGVSYKEGLFLFGDSLGWRDFEAMHWVAGD